MPFFEANGFRMHYEVYENAVPQDTLFIHGNLASNIWWQPALEAWGKQSSQFKGKAILAEWRGCGKSTGPELEKELTIPNLANDYIELVQYLNLKDCNIVAHSTGGPIAIQALWQAPELFRRAALLDPVAATGIQFPPETYSVFTQMSQNKSLCEAVILSTIYEGVCSQAVKEKIVSDAFGVHPLIWHGVPKMLHQLDLRPILDKIKQPVFVLHGENDNVLPLEDSVELAKGIKNARFYKIPARGHSANVEDAQLFTMLIDPFLFG